MTNEERHRARGIVLRSPTRPRYQGDTVIIVRENDLTPAERELVRGLASEVGAVMRPTAESELRESETVPILGDTEIEFRIDTLE